MTDLYLETINTLLNELSISIGQLATLYYKNNNGNDKINAIRALIECNQMINEILIRSAQAQ